jgi:hypothetical protein
VPWPRIETGFGGPLGFAAGIATTMVVVAAGATRHPGAGLVAVVVTVAVVSAVTTCAGAAMTAATCWALYAGFVLGRAGQLVLTESSARALLVLLVTGVVATALGAAARLAHTSRHVGSRAGGSPTELNTSPSPSGSFAAWSRRHAGTRHGG